MVKKSYKIILIPFLILSFCVFFKPVDAQQKAADPCGQTATQKPCDPVVTKTATPDASGFDLNIRIQNPLKAQTIQDAIKLFMGIILKLAIPVIIFFFLWTGFSYITALGNPTKVGKAHTMFLYTIIGTLLVLGAWAITNAIVGTINAIVTP